MNYVEVEVEGIMLGLVCWVCVCVCVIFDCVRGWSVVIDDHDLFFFSDEGEGRWEGSAYDYMGIDNYCVYNDWWLLINNWLIVVLEELDL